MTEAIKSYVEADAFWDSLTEEQQIQAAVVMFRKLNEHAKVKGSFRHMLCVTFGWGSHSYSAIYAAGGMKIHGMLYESDQIYQQPPSVDPNLACGLDKSGKCVFGEEAMRIGK